MAGMSNTNIQDVNFLHALPVSSLRDASRNAAPPTISWGRGEPVPIPVPQKNGRRPSFPFTRSLMGSNSNSKHSVGNVTASRTVFQSQSVPPAKRRKMDHAERLTKSTVPLAPEPPEVHVISDDEARAPGTRTPTAPPDSDDEVSTIDRPFVPPATVKKPQFGNNKSKSETHPFDLPQKANRSRPRLKHQGGIPDGSNTKAMAERFRDTADVLAVDPIEEFPADDKRLVITLDDGTKVVSGSKDGFVKTRVRQIEFGGSAERRVDLTKLSLTMKMKPKHGGKPEKLLDPIATAESNFSRSKGKQKSDEVTRKCHVHIKEWFLGYQHIEADGSHLEWDTRQKLLFFKSLSCESGRDLITLTLSPQEVRCMIYADEERMDLSILQFKTNEGRKDADTKSFEMGNARKKGDITVLVDSSVKGCSVDYPSFVAALKPHFKTETVRKPADRSIWQTASDYAASYTQSRTSEEEESSKRPRSSSLESIDDADLIRMTEKQEPESSISRFFRKAAPPSATIRRSSRQVEAKAKAQERLVDPDEVILRYPREGPGAVNVTNADLNRLQPGEFLNDTLIEFGLKLWLSRVEEQDPQLAQQIHVFSSFFYKKLNRKNIDEGYQSVRKWTSKTDIFGKKYVIVPINENYHWYLVIICNPEYVLLPPPPTPSRPTRQKTQKSTEDDPQGPAVEKPPDTTDAPIEKPRDIHVIDEEPVDFGGQADGTATEGSTRPPSEKDMEVDEDNRSIVSIPDEMEVDELRPASVHRERSLSVSEMTSEAVPLVDNAVDIDMEPTPSESAVEQLVAEQSSPVAVPKESTGVPPSRFYSSNASRAKEKENAPAFPSTDAVEATDEVEIQGFSALENSTYIFTLDSLGSRHPQASRQLSEYLRREALDKKGLSETRKPFTKAAQVPVQPNSCDCGLYLLHFVETFMSDPAKYFALITTPKKKTSTALDRHVEWQEDKTIGMRERLISEIESRSIEWKKERAAKEQQKKKENAIVIAEEVSDTDDEINIVETKIPSKATPDKGKGKAEGPVGKAARIR